MTLNNEILEEIHQYREEHAKAFHYDVAAMFADWRNRQAKSGKKAITLSPKKSDQSGKATVS
jgi:hypothetical protein